MEQVLGMVSIVEQQGIDNPEQSSWIERNKIDQTQAILEERGY